MAFGDLDGVLGLTSGAVQVELVWPAAWHAVLWGLVFLAGLLVGRRCPAAASAPAGGREASGPPRSRAAEWLGGGEDVPKEKFEKGGVVYLLDGRVHGCRVHGGGGAARRRCLLCWSTPLERSQDQVWLTARGEVVHRSQKCGGLDKRRLEPEAMEVCFCLRRFG